SRSRNASRLRTLIARGGYHDKPFVPELFHSLDKYILIAYRPAGSPHGNIYNTDAVLLPVIQNPAESPEHLFPASVAETVKNRHRPQSAAGSHSFMLPHGCRPVSRQYSGHMGAVAVIVIRHAFIRDKIGKGADPVPEIHMRKDPCVKNGDSHAFSGIRQVFHEYTPEKEVLF